MRSSSAHAPSRPTTAALNAASRTAGIEGWVRTLRLVQLGAAVRGEDELTRRLTAKLSLRNPRSFRSRPPQERR